ncbi:MAG: alpha/beta fold hydrolase [Bacteriovoracaceae bacterium]
MNLFVIFILIFFSACSSVQKEKVLFRDVDGAKLKVIERGDTSKIPVILIHGGPGHPGAMWNLAELIPNHYTIEYFQRDIKNSPSIGPFTVDAHVSDLHNLIKLYRKPPILIGHSWGATLALEYAKKYNGEVLKIIIISPGSMTSQMTKDFANNIFKSAKGNENKARKMWEELKNIKDTQEYQKKYKEYFDLIKYAYCFDCKNFMHEKMTYKPVGIIEDEENLKSVKAINKDYWSMVEQGKIIEGYSRIKDGVIHLQPEFDVNPTNDLIKHLKSRIENYKLYFIKKAGHFPWLEPESRNIVIEILNEELKVQ